MSENKATGGGSMKEVKLTADGKELNILSESAITLAIELCGTIDMAIELMSSGTKAEYWQGILDAIKAQDRIEKRGGSNNAE
jgi:hypothetical protein